MTTRRQNTPDHKCDLPQEPDDILSTYIEKGIFVELRRKLKRFTMVNVKHPMCKFYIHSLSLLRTEEKVHLIKHYYMIHPFSMANFYWKVYIAIILFGTCFIWPVVTAYLESTILRKLFTLSNASHLVFIILSFVTGYHDKSKNIVVMKPRKVLINYLTTYFVVDMLAMAIVFVREITINSQDSIFKSVPGHVRFNKMKVLSWSLSLCKFGRYPYFLGALQEIRYYYRINHYLFQAAIMLMNFIFFLLFTVTVIYIIIGQFHQFYHRSHLDGVKSALGMLLMVSHGYHTSDHIADKIFPIICIPFGFLIHLLIYVVVMKIWFQYYSTENKQISVYNSINAFMRYNALPLQMRNRIFLYLDFKYQGHYYKNASILRATSQSLRQEILIEVSQSTSKMLNFEDIPHRLVQKLRESFITSIFLPGDTIIRPGTIGKCMYFIKNGTVRVTTPSGKEVCRLKDGDHFGESALFADIPRVAEVTAVTPCEFFVLYRRHFLDVFKRHPEIVKNLRTVFTDRIAAVQNPASNSQMFEMSDSNSIIPDEIEEDSATDVYVG